LPASDSLSIFFPAWNEQDGLERTVLAALEAGERMCAAGQLASVEVLIVDDASTDNTAAIADALAEGDDRVRVVHHAVNRGLGGAIRTGLASATGDLVLYTDADLPFDLAELDKAVRVSRVYDADVVSLYRLDRTGEGPRRFVYSYIYNHLVRLLFGLRVRDVNFAGKLVTRRVLDAVDLHSEGSFIDVELLVQAQRRGFNIMQFGVDYFPRTRGVSTLSSWPVIAGIARELITLRRQLAGITPDAPSTGQHGSATPPQAP
jgi:glycosyltransferase involved in cell wall biosynthesis